MDKKILEEKLDNVALFSWLTGVLTIIFYNIINKGIDYLEISPAWIGTLLSILISAIFIFISFIIAMLISRKFRDKEE